MLVEMQDDVDELRESSMEGLSIENAGILPQAPAAPGLCSPQPAMEQK
jgi:hypothetical protein